MTIQSDSAPGGSQSARLGALDLQFNGAPSADGQISTFSIQFDRSGTRPYIQLAMRFGLTDVQPGGEDDLPGEEFLRPSALLGRPLVVSLGTGSPVGAAPSFYLAFVETTSQGQSQAISLTLTRSDSAPPASQRTVVVIDSQPFLIARVQVPSFLQGADQTSQAGSWSNTAANGARWQIAGGFIWGWRPPGASSLGPCWARIRLV